MSDRYAIVVTTINSPTEALRAVAGGAPRIRADVIIIGDEKSPAGFALPGAHYLDIAQQRATPYRYAQIAPTRHYARKNVGYLTAMERGATVIIETDDDNFPTEKFWTARSRVIEAEGVPGEDWVNVYRYFTDSLIWPRGLPLKTIHRPTVDLTNSQTFDCPIQQGLADGDPDVDAIYRLTLPLPLSFAARAPVALSGSWCPFNSQNTAFWLDAFPLLYLPYYCSFRMTDIWRSFVAQRICYLNGWSILFHEATVHQDRNEHDLLRDFKEEIDGYLHNGRIREVLDQLDLTPGISEIPNAMRLSYRCLVDAGFIRHLELELLDAWLEDCAAAVAASSGARQ